LIVAVSQARHVRAGAMLPRGMLSAGWCLQSRSQV
jgi:hypothetical protein